MSNPMLARLGVIYGPPQSVDPKAFLDEMENMLGKYSAEVLDKAADRVIRTHRGRQWPTPSECINACEDVLEVDRSHAARKPQDERYPEWSSSAIAKADKLIQSELGRRAAREGWISTLWDYCRSAGALPDNPTAIHRCKSYAKDFDEAYASLLRGDGSSMLNASLKKLGDSMLERRERLAKLALGAGQ